MPTDRLDYDVVDVFADRPFSGNPLAVVYGADDLTTAQCQAIAAEFNLSETAFPQLSQQEVDAGADYRTRIFTPVTEIPFAGHPTLGTAWALRRRGLVEAGDRVQACGAGPIPVLLPDDPAGPVELTATPRDAARPLTAGDTARAAGLVGLSEEDVRGPGYVAGCGLSWLYLQVDAASVSRARPEGRRVEESGIDLAGLRDPLDGVSVYAVTGPPAEDVLRLDARVFVPGYGIPEDPATGSAAAGLGLVLVAAGLLPGEGDGRFELTQGVLMGRPSRLLGRVRAADGHAVESRVAGTVVHIASGTIAVPALPL